MSRLTQQEINRRMQQWRNDRMLEPRRKKRMQELEERCARLEAENAQQKLTIETLFLRIEQLEKMVFGQTRKKPDDHDDLPPSSGSSSASQQARTSGSYRRPIPDQQDVTDRSQHPLSACPDCHHPLSRTEMVIRFIEDIPLANPNVRLYILFAVTVLGLTFEKIKAHLQGMHGLSISDGELGLIIQEGHRKLLPKLKDIEGRIREAPVAHYDETSWPMQRGGEGKFAWVKTSAVGPETIFRLGRSRGKGNAEKLRGKRSSQVAVTDDYKSYHALFKNHALCWAHPLRKFRDLAKSRVFSSELHNHCLGFYERFHILERSVALTLAAPLSPMERHEAAVKFGKEIDTLMVIEHLDPPALKTLKKTFLQNREKYLVCLRIPNVPMTNNKAERSLRHLVIKRLISFGSRSQKGAQAMETLLSVLLTLWWSKPKDYFGALQIALTRPT